MRNTSNKLELQKRIRMVQEWILQDHTSTDIITQAISLWNVTDRQAYRYLWAANRFFEERGKASLNQRINYYLARKRKLLREMDPGEKKTAAGVAAVSRVLDSMAKMEGISMETIKLIGDPKQPVATIAQVGYTSSTIDYSKLTTPFLKQLLSQMDAN